MGLKISFICVLALTSMRGLCLLSEAHGIVHFFFYDFVNFLRFMWINTLAKLVLKHGRTVELNI